MTNDFPNEFRAIATVRDVARMVALSPSRFYQLQQAGVFPMPVYDIITRRPHYTVEQQRECLEVRRRNCGINGKPVLFYARRLDAPVRPATARPRKSKSERPVNDQIVNGIRSLGMSSVSSQTVGAAVRKVFPSGTTGVDPAEVIRNVFLHLKQQN